MNIIYTRRIKIMYTNRIEGHGKKWDRKVQIEKSKQKRDINVQIEKGYEILNRIWKSKLEP